MKPAKKTKINPGKQPSAKVRPVIKDTYVLRLFVAGATTRSHRAVLQVRELCQTILAGRAKLEVIDIYQQPALARKNQIVATPTLIMHFPVPVRRFIGNLTTITELFSDRELAAKSRIAS